MLCGIYSVDNSLYLYTSLCVYSFSVCLSCWIVSLGKAGTVSGLVATPSLCLAQCLAHCTLVLVTRSCATLCNPVRGCPMPGSSVHGILQARVLECVAIPFSAGSSQPRDQTQVSCIAGRFFTAWATRAWSIVGTLLISDTKSECPQVSGSVCFSSFCVFWAWKALRTDAMMVSTTGVSLWSAERQENLVVKRVYSGARLSRFKSQLCLLLPACNLANYLTCLWLCFPLGQMELISESTYEG